MGITLLAIYLLLIGLEGVGVTLHLPGQVMGVLCLLSGLLLLIGR